VRRTLKDKYERPKPHVNIGTIGHVDHGKTTLTAAITKVLSMKGNEAAMPFQEEDPIENINLDNLTGITINPKAYCKNNKKRRRKRNKYYVC